MDEASFHDLFECDFCQEVKDHCRQLGMVWSWAMLGNQQPTHLWCSSHDFGWCSLVVFASVEAPKDLLLNTLRSMGNGSFGLKILQFHPPEAEVKVIGGPILDNVISAMGWCGFKLPSLMGLRINLWNRSHYHTTSTEIRILPNIFIIKIRMRFFLIILSHWLISSKLTSDHQFWSQGVSAGSVVAAMLAIGCEAQDIFKLTLGRTPSVWQTLPSLMMGKWLKWPLPILTCWIVA